MIAVVVDNCVDKLQFQFNSIFNFNFDLRLIAFEKCFFTRRTIEKDKSDLRLIVVVVDNRVDKLPSSITPKPVTKTRIKFETKT